MKISINDPVVIQNIPEEKKLFDLEIEIKESDVQKLGDRTMRCTFQCKTKGCWG